MLFILWYHIMMTFIKVPTSTIIIMLTLSVRGHRDEYLVGIGQWLSYIPVLLDCRDKPESRGRQQQSTSASTLSVYGMWQPVCGCVGGCLWVCEGRRITTATRHNNNPRWIHSRDWKATSRENQVATMNPYPKLSLFSRAQTAVAYRTLTKHPAIRILIDPVWAIFGHKEIWMNGMTGSWSFPCIHPSQL